MNATERSAAGATAGASGSWSVARRRVHLLRKIAHAAAARDRASVRLAELRAELEPIDGPETVA